VAAETLEEVEPRLQKALLEKLGEERIADIVEEMDPGAAADLLAELPEEQSDAILEEMEPEERQEVAELLEFDEDSAAGCMTTDFVSLGKDATVAQAVEALRGFDGDPESVTEIYLLDESACCAAPSLSPGSSWPSRRRAWPCWLKPASTPAPSPCTRMSWPNSLTSTTSTHCRRRSQGRMVGVVQADHVISFLRENL